jgi:hypothetical protein
MFSLQPTQEVVSSSKKKVKNYEEKRNKLLHHSDMNE